MQARGREINRFLPKPHNYLSKVAWWWNHDHNDLYEALGDSIGDAWTRPTRLLLKSGIYVRYGVLCPDWSYWTIPSLCWLLGLPQRSTQA